MSVHAKTEMFSGSIVELVTPFKDGEVDWKSLEETSPIPIKTALALMGKCSGDLRLPMTAMSESNVEKLREVMSLSGFHLKQEEKT